MAEKYKPNSSFLHWMNLTLDDLWVFRMHLSVSAECSTQHLSLAGSELTPATGNSQLSRKWPRWPSFTLCPRDMELPPTSMTLPSFVLCLWKHPASRAPEPARQHVLAKFSFFHFYRFSPRAKGLLSLWRTASTQINFSIRGVASQHTEGYTAAPGMLLIPAKNLHGIMAETICSN